MLKSVLPKLAIAAIVAALGFVGCLIYTRVTGDIPQWEYILGGVCAVVIIIFALAMVIRVITMKPGERLH